MSPERDQRSTTESTEIHSAAEPQTPDVRTGRVRRACDDAPLSFPVRLCDAPYLLPGGNSRP